MDPPQHVTADVVVYKLGKLGCQGFRIRLWIQQQVWQVSVPAVMAEHLCDSEGKHTNALLLPERVHT